MSSEENKRIASEEQAAESRKAMCKEIEEFSYFFTHLLEIAAIIEFPDPDLFLVLALNPKSDIGQAVNRGQFRAKADVRRAIVTAAASGSTPAMKEALQLMREFQNDIDFNHETA